MGFAYCQCNYQIRKTQSIRIQEQTDPQFNKEQKSSVVSIPLIITSNKLNLTTITCNQSKLLKTQLTKRTMSRRHSSIFKSTICFESIIRDENNKTYNSERVGQMRKPYKELPCKRGDQVDSTNVLLNPMTNIPDKKINQKDVAHIITINTPFSDNQLQLIRDLLTKEDLIQPHMDETIINCIINIITYIKVKKNVVLYSFENKLENIYYIIEKGKLLYSVDNNKQVLRKYDGIGTKVLRIHSKESCQLKTIDRSYLYCLPVEKYKAILKKYSEKQEEDKYQILKECVLFCFLDNSIVRKLASKSIMLKYKHEKEIIEVGLETKSLYVIAEGTVNMIRNSIIIDQLFQGDIFGEIFFFTQLISNCSYSPEPETTIIEVSYELIDKTIGEKALNTIIFGVFNSAIQKCDYLNKHLSGDRLLPVFESFEIKLITNGAVTNNKTKRIFIPISGAFRKTHVTQLGTQKKLEIFKGQDVIKGDIYITSILSSQENETIYSNQSIIFQANWLDIMKKISFLSQKGIIISDLIHIIRNISFLHNLSELKLFLIGDSLKIKKYKEDQPILINGPISHYFFIIKTGFVKVIMSNKEMKTLSGGNYFGDFSSSPSNYPKTVTFVAKGIVECYSLDKEDYNEIIENVTMFSKPLYTLFNSKRNNITLDSLYYIKELGYGTYGKVFLVHNGESLLALKTADIQAMSSQKQLADYYLNEKKIMLSMNHPFIIKLNNTFKTRDFIFFILEYVEGITLREYIDQRKKESLRKSNEIYFYGGILFIVLNYLQKQRIIHRDLKPENVMINSQGYLKVIDFGIAKDLSGTDSTHTMFGTPHYMAPEIILGKKYNFAVDYWSVGVILYELFYGKYPFGMGCTNNNIIFKEITENKLIFPTDPQHKSFNLLLKDLLCKIPTKRINSFDQIKSHPFFESFNFESLNDMTMKPLFFPPKQEAISMKVDESLQFSWFMKNYITSSSIEGLNTINKQKENDYFSDF